MSIQSWIPNGLGLTRIQLDPLASIIHSSSMQQPLSPMQQCSSSPILAVSHFPKRSSNIGSESISPHAQVIPALSQFPHMLK